MKKFVLVSDPTDTAPIAMELRLTFIVIKKFTFQTEIHAKF
jgi:hypothetical protein